VELLIENVLCLVILTFDLLGGGQNHISAPLRNSRVQLPLPPVPSHGLDNISNSAYAAFLILGLLLLSD